LSVCFGTLAPVPFSEQQKKVVKTSAMLAYAQLLSLIKPSGRSMRIESVRIQNFRAFRDQTVFLGPYTCLAGPNGGGKSTVLTALNLFFRYSLDVSTNLLQLDEEDFHSKDVAQPVTITVTLTDLSADAQADFAGYYRQGRLVVTASAEWNTSTRRAEVKQYGQRLGVLAFAPFFKADGDGAKVDELKKHYSAIQAKSFSSKLTPLC
jgi:putative ATP-dependent endonuclease of OLD family